MLCYIMHSILLWIVAIQLCPDNKHVPSPLTQSIHVLQNSDFTLHVASITSLISGPEKTTAFSNRAIEFNFLHRSAKWKWINHVYTLQEKIRTCEGKIRDSYLTGSHDSLSKPLWIDWAMEDSIRSTYRTTRGAYRSCRCLWNFPLHRLSERERDTVILVLCWLLMTLIISFTRWA